MAAKLKVLGIRTTENLMAAARTPPARRSLADKLGIDETTVLGWANLADSMRIKGVRERYAELLRAAGVDSIRELQYRNAAKLAELMAEANRKRKLVTVDPASREAENADGKPKSAKAPPRIQRLDSADCEPANMAFVPCEPPMPPAASEWLLALCVPPKKVEAVLGDARELFERNVRRSGRTRAAWLYRAHVLRSISPLLRRKFKTWGVIALVVAAARKLLG